MSSQQDAIFKTKQEQRVTKLAVMLVLLIIMGLGMWIVIVLDIVGAAHTRHPGEFNQAAGLVYLLRTSWSCYGAVLTILATGLVWFTSIWWRNKNRNAYNISAAAFDLSLAWGMLVLIALFLFTGCATQPAPSPSMTPQIPSTLTTTPRTAAPIPPDPMQSLPQSVRDAITSGRRPVLHQGITTLFPYSENAEWTIHCKPLHATEIRLAPDERTDKDNVILGDSVRWGDRVGGHVVMVEPLADTSNPNMNTNLIIAAGQRSYHLILKLGGRFTPAVAWYYPDDVLAAQAARQSALREVAADQLNQPTTAKFNCAYRITGNAPWKPSEVCDNGQNEFIGLAPAPGSDVPALTVQNGKQQETVNYTQDGQWIKTDRIFRAAVLTSGVGSNQQIVRIEAE